MTEKKKYGCMAYGYMLMAVGCYLMAIACVVSIVGICLAPFFAGLGGMFMTMAGVKP